MHELGLCSELYDTLIDFMKTNGLTEVKEVSLKIGEATGVVPEFLLKCWPAVSEKTVLKDMIIKYDFIRVMGRCHNCDNEFYVAENHGVCPKCHSDDYDIMTGYEFEIFSIKAH